MATLGQKIQAWILKVMLTSKERSRFRNKQCWVQRVQPLAIMDNLLQQFVLASKRCLWTCFLFFKGSDAIFHICHCQVMQIVTHRLCPGAPQRKMCYVNALCYHTKANAPSSVTHSASLQSKTILKVEFESLGSPVLLRWRFLRHKALNYCSDAKNKKIINAWIKLRLYSIIVFY